MVRKAEKDLDSGCRLNVEPAGFADGLDAEGRESGVKRALETGGSLLETWGSPAWRRGGDFGEAA